MTVKEAMMTLNQEYNDDDEIIIAWWDKRDSPCDKKLVTWKDQIDIIKNKMDWSGVHEDMRTCIEQYKEYQIHKNNRGYE